MKNDWKKYIDKEVEWIKLQFKTVSDFAKVERKGLNKRLDGMNEIKGAMKDQQALLASREWVEARLTGNRESFESKQKDQQKQINDLEEEIEGLKLSRERLAGMATQSSVNRTAIFAIIGIILSAVAIFMKIT